MAGRIANLDSGGKIVFDWSEFAKVRKLGQKEALKIAEDLAHKADNYPQPGPRKRYRARKGKNISALVEPATPHARNSNAKHNTLVKLLGGAGG
ncbi:hypothetical protein [Corynebacterium renale]|uniref:hypothetical protein n=1 Tax=Corynebacterium renale TaxID=1724 RepID=UPI000E05898E|nr:hypothetical protein [Corynebacterium renale]STC97554.1 Uncharacterised protein [Corynebacterium renale]